MGVNHTTGFSHNIKMGALKLCLVLLFCVLQYHGSAAKCEDKYDECGLMSAAGGCQEEGEWGDFVKESCPKSCELCGEVKAHGFDAYLSGESCTPKTLNLKANPKLKKECEASGCGKCEGNVPLPVDCKDACPDQCQKGAAAGKCADKNSYIYQQCPCHGQQYGQFPVRGECTKWCHCSNYMGVVKDCPDCDRLSGHPLCAKYGHTLFDPSIGQCDWPEKVIAKRRDC